MHVSFTGTVIHRFGIHTHAPSNPRVESLRVLEAVRMEAATSQHPTARVLTNNYPNVAAHLPSKSSACGREHRQLQLILWIGIFRLFFI